ncbi:hypothetical protein K461DRAFT_264217 [Myriangium duriaei CBS 260.36]|uniref:BRCT domain-containing protein n=1 Tax=Myriangium duriaei CBS 260.36 TaxID=1168546 RepID=A0A9P4J9G4_9PEZI|nr:hypothetical protein K461DRAFT_264217 [Myriangium duriaei CBS 260.36]
MPTTRAMAQKASTASEDKENDAVHSLRKKPVRRAAAKTVQKGGGRKTAPALTRSAIPPTVAPEGDLQHHIMPLSPKKNVQVPQTRSRLRVDKMEAANTEIGGTKARRPVRATSVKVAPSVRAQVQNQRKPRSGPLPLSQGQQSQPQNHERDGMEPPTRDDSRRATRATKIETEICAKGPSGSQPSAPSVTSSPVPVAIKRRSELNTPSVHRKLYDDRISPISSQGTPETRSVRVPALDKNQSSPLAQRLSTFHVDFQVHEEEESDDEICGPNTPLPRANHIECRTNSNRSALKPSLKTPRDKMLVYRSHGDYFSQTQKVPVKSATEPSPRRPVSVSRGSSMSYVFHPLPKASRANSPLKGPYQWPVTPSDEGSDPLDDVASTTSSRRSRPNTPGYRRTGTSERTSEARDRLISLFVSDPADDDDTDDDEADDDAGFPKLGEKRTHDQNANAAYIPENPEGSDDDDDSLSTTAENSHDSSICGGDKSEIFDTSVDETELLPELHSELMQSTPTVTAPEFSYHPRSSPLASDDELGETPTLTRITHFTTSSSRPTPRPRVSFVLDDEQQSMHTPGASRRITGSAFKTPSMKSALDEFDHTSQSVHNVTESQDTTYIDPSLLSQCAGGITSPRKDSMHMEIVGVQDVPTKTSPRLNSEAFSKRLSSPVKSPMHQAENERTARLSLLINTEALVETPVEQRGFCLEDSIITMESSTSQTVSPLASRTTHAPLPESENSSIMNHSVLPHDGASHHALTDTRTTDLFGEQILENVVPDTPHYALPTLSYDARRKSMPALVAKTPQQDARFSTAETVVKPGATAPFAHAWLERLPQMSDSPSRRQSLVSLGSATPRHQSQSSGLPRAVSSLGVREKSSLPQLRKSIGGHENSVTPVHPAMTPRPRCYTPSIPFANIKLASNKIQTPSSPPKTSSPRKMVSLSPPKACTSPRKTPMRPTTAASVAFTPHPKAPLSGVVAFVEVFTRSGLDASSSFVAALQRLGARTTKTFNDRVTHVVFKDGSPTTLSKVRVARKDGQHVCVVNSRWVTDCDHQGTHVDENAEDYQVELEGSTPTVALARRRKSMEPHALTKDEETARKSSARLSVASSLWAESPMKGEWDEAGFSDDEDECLEDTPVQQQGEWRKAPGSVPVQRMKKLDLGGVAGRRLTAWEERD